MLRQIHHATRILIIATLIFCVACLLNSNLTGNGSPPILVAFHGPIMVCAFMLISAGMSAYVSDFGSAVSGQDGRRKQRDRAMKPAAAFNLPLSLSFFLLCSSTAASLTVAPGGFCTAACSSAGRCSA